MRRLKQNLPLIILMLFSACLYLFRLNSLPASVYVDEATVGYNAYSILNNARDEFDQKMPIYFRFFNAYTPGLYVYAILPFVKLFGLSAFSIRFLSALCGLISVYYFYRTLKIFSSKALLPSFFYALLPWTVFNSRLGYEVMFAATLFNVGIYYLLRDLSRTSFLGLFLISLSTYAAHTQRYLAPLFLLFYFIFFQKLNKKSFIFLFLTQIPNFIMLFTPAFWVKNSNFSLNTFFVQFITLLSPKTLFFSLPDIDLQHQIPSTSVFFWWLIIPFFIGLSKLSKLSTIHRRFLLLWIIISIIPGCFSGEFISIQRALPLLTPLMILISLALPKSLPLNLLLFLYSSFLLVRSYFFFFPRDLALAWNYGYQQFTQFALEHPSQNFLVDNTRNPRNYILPLFYSQRLHHFPLNNYFSAPHTEDIYHYDNLTFKKINWEEVSDYDFLVADPLSVSTQQATDHHLRKIITIFTPNQQSALDIYIVDQWP